MKKSNEIYKERLVRISGLQLVRIEASVKINYKDIFALQTLKIYLFRLLSDSY